MCDHQNVKLQFLQIITAILFVLLSSVISSIRPFHLWCTRSSNSKWILMSCQPQGHPRVTSGQLNSDHKQIHISKLFSHIHQPSVKSIYKTNHKSKHKTYVHKHQAQISEEPIPPILTPLKEHNSSFMSGIQYLLGSFYFHLGTLLLLGVLNAFIWGIYSHLGHFTLILDSLRSRWAIHIHLGQSLISFWAFCSHFGHYTLIWDTLI